MRIIVVDTGLGNLRSVERALREAAHRTGEAATIEVSRDPSTLAEADKIVMPGQGAFRDCSMALDGGWRAALRSSIERGTPYLGICLGLQVLFERSDEADASCKGLGLFPGAVRRLPGGADALTGQPLPIPHVGRTLPTPLRATRSSPRPRPISTSSTRSQSCPTIHPSWPRRARTASPS